MVECGCWHWLGVLLGVLDWLGGSWVWVLEMLARWAGGLG